MSLPLPIAYPVYYPELQLISAITNSIAAVITTSAPHGYSSLLIVRLVIPIAFGMQQANQAVGTIIVLNNTQFIMVQDGPNGLTSFNTTMFDPFIVPASYSTPAQVIPIGESTATLINATYNVLPL
jgi:hypothetical protein